MKVLVPIAVAASAILAVQLYGDDIEIPDHFLAAEKEACLRRAESVAGPAVAETYCACVATGLRKSFRFKTYILRNANMAWQAHREDVPVSTVAARDPLLRGIHQSCRAVVMNG